jgi:crossover junction endodeoxyribonuclease RuvC
MIVFGIDPGYATIGYGAVEYRGGRCHYLGHGAIVTRPGPSLAQRLGEIHRDCAELLALWRPEAVAIEQLFFNSNQKTAIFVAQARGVLLLACQQAGLEPWEYTPLQVKMAVSGNGRAPKKQVQEMVRTLLKLDSIPKPDDAADALAIAICHAVASGSRMLTR